jgi:transposase
VEETDEAVELVERVAALDIGKATLTCCIRIPHETNPARRRQEVNEYSPRPVRCSAWPIGCAAMG